MPMNKPKPRTDLVDFVETEREETPDAQTSEIIHAYQEDVCKHTKTRIVIAQTASKKLLKCPDCGDIKEGK